MKLGSTQINKVYLGATEANKLYLGTNLIYDNSSIDTVVTIDTTSTSATWTPTNIVNSGATLTWEVTGGVVIAPQVIDKPILNLSSNTGTANITITSSTGFVGFTELWLNNGTTSLEVTDVDISEATALTKIDLFNNNLTTIDISANTALVNPWVQSNVLTAFDPSTNVLAEFIAVDTNSLTALDISANVLLTDLWAYDNLLTTAELDAIINDLDTNGLSNGVVKLAGNTGLPLTAASGTAYDALVGKGWTIDVAKYTPVDIIGPVIGTLAYANETDTTVELSMSVASTDNIAVVEHWIYKDFVFEEIVVGATFTDHEITGLTANTNYDFTCVAYDAAGNFSLTSNIVNFTTDATPTPPATDDLRPVISNFRVLDSQKGRVYFDSSEIITASTGVNGYTGFTITDKVINQITINSGSLKNHYFDVTEDFNFYSNNTIRYAGGSDLADSDSGALYNFDLQNIVNNIVQPSTNSTKFVAVGASGGGNSIGDPMVWSDAQSVAAGTLVNWEKGDYGAINFVQSTSGTLALPIVHEGYDTTPGDSPSLTFAVDLAFDANIMPYINSVSSSGSGFSLGGKDYIIVKNIQVEGYAYTINFGGQSEYCVLDNVYAMDSSIYTIMGFYTSLVQCRVINSFIGKSLAHGIRLAGNRHRLEDCYISSDGTIDMDYYVSIYAAASGNGENILRGLTVIRDPLTTHTGHGISLRQGGVGRAIQNTLVENCYVEAVGSAALELRSEGVEYCVMRNIEVNNLNLTTGTFNAMRITSAQNNIIDGLVAYDCEIFIRFYASDEEQSSTDALDSGNNNLFKNCVFYNNPLANSNWAIVGMEDKTAQNRVPNNNTFANCTFNNIRASVQNIVGNNGTGNQFINCIFNDIFEEWSANQNNWAYSYSNFYVSFPVPSGTNNISVKPNFTDIDGNDYSLSSLTHVDIYEGGTDTGVYYDIEGNECITPFSQGAHKKNSTDVYPDYFVDEVNGSDSNDGSTEFLPWETLNKVKITTFSAGEIIGFKKGTIWDERLVISETGTNGSPITFTSYGSGNNPTFNQVLEFSSTWTSVGGNIWYNDTAISIDPDRIKLDGIEVQRCYNYSELGTDLSGSSFSNIGTFWWGDNDSLGSNHLYIYSIADPGTRTVEMNQEFNALNVTDSAYLIFENLNLIGGYAPCIQTDNNDNIIFRNLDVGEMCHVGMLIEHSTTESTNITIEDCTFDSKFELDFNGVGTYSGATTLGTENGLSISSLVGATIKNNTFTNWGHVSFQLSSATNSVTNVKAYGNTCQLLSNMTYGGGITLDGLINGNEIYNNKIIGTKQSQLNGYNNHIHDNIFLDTVNSPLKSFATGHAIIIQGYFASGRADLNIIENNVMVNCEGAGIFISGNNDDSSVENNIIKNNIIYECGTDYSNIGLEVSTKINTFLNDNNDYLNNDIYNSSTSNTIDYYGSTITVTTFNTKTDHSNTVSSNISSDPDFVDDDVNWRLQDGSPCIGTGTTALSTADHYGNDRPFQTTDIGINETNQPD